MQRIDQIMVRRYRGTPLQPVVDMARLHREWPRLVGEPWGGVSRPIRLHNGVLFLAVPDASWAQRLAYDGRALARKVEGYLGYAVTLRHRVAAPQAPAPAWSPLEPLTSDPRVAAAVAAVPAGRLRDALTTYLGYFAAHNRNHTEETK